MTALGTLDGQMNRMNRGLNRRVHVQPTESVSEYPFMNPMNRMKGKRVLGDSRVLWDVRALDAAIDCLPSPGDSPDADNSDLNEWD